MDALQPPPGPALLSAQEAKERLREIVEGFFFRRLRTDDGGRVGRLLVKSPPGLGKTRPAIKSAVRYRAELEGKDLARLPRGNFNEARVTAQTAIFVPRHQLAEELRKVIEGAFRECGEPVTVPILRGRENGGEEGRAPCRRWREAHELSRKGLPIYINLCQRKSDGQSSQCPYFAGCEYIQTRQAAYCSPFVILVHSHLGLEWGATAAERLYEEEDGATESRASVISIRSRPISSSVTRTADDIQVREATAPDPRVTANTVPSPRPTKNPNPNTAVAAPPSNAAPDFPSGDN